MTTDREIASLALDAYAREAEERRLARRAARAAKKRVGSCSRGGGGMNRGRGERGRSRTTLDLIATCFNIIAARQPITVRGVCYQLFVAGHIDSMAVKNTQKISRILTDAREAGEIPWEWIVDETRSMERQPRWSDLEAYAQVIERSYRRDFWSDRDERVIVILEKSTVSGLLRPTLEQYGVPFFACHGFNSATKIHDLAEEISHDERHYVFLYVGDYDCSGMYMSEMDFPSRLEKYGAESGDFDFTRVALTDADTADLPSFTAKKQDPRYSWYFERYGEDCWELDAMDPNNLRERVEMWIKEYIDLNAWERHQVIERAQRKTTKMIAAQMAAMQEGA